METTNLLNYESSRMKTFRFLSDCYFLPNSELTEKMEYLEFNMAHVCESAVEWVRGMRKEFKTGKDLGQLKVDFSKLFVGPYNLLAAPYGSVYLDDERKVMGDSTLDVKSRYREAGLDTAANFKDAPDHITAELEFMHYLIYKETESFASSEIEAAIDFIQRQKSFLEDHLMVWVPKFTISIIENAENLFYPNLARATETFLKENYKIVCTFLDPKRLNSEKPVEINSLRV